MEGPAADTIDVGDIVMVRKPAYIESNPGKIKAAEDKWGSKCFPDFLRVKRKIDKHTVILEDPNTPEANIPRWAMGTQSVDRLVKMDMPELDMSANQNRRLEVMIEEGNVYEPATLERIAVDGRCALRYDSNPGEAVWVDLSRCSYRWLA